MDCPYVDLQPGASFKLGRYPYSAYGTEAPIEWLIVQKDKDSLWVVTLHGLDTIAVVDESKGKLNWSSCALREFANGRFLERSFTPEEREFILLTTLETESFIYGADRSSTVTEDYVFALSANEVERFFPDAPSCKCKATPFAVAHGAKPVRANVWWWLRNAGMGSHSAAVVMDDGTVNRFGLPCDDHSGCLRLAMRVALPADED